MSGRSLSRHLIGVRLCDREKSLAHLAGGKLGWFAKQQIARNNVEASRWQRAPPHHGYSNVTATPNSRLAVTRMRMLIGKPESVIRPQKY